MWLNLLGMGVKTAAKLYQDKQKTKEALSGAKLLHSTNRQVWQKEN